LEYGADLDAKVTSDGAKPSLAARDVIREIFNENQADILLGKKMEGSEEVGAESQGRELQNTMKQIALFRLLNRFNFKK
jgi:hypothetical protein